MMQSFSDAQIDELRTYLADALRSTNTPDPAPFLENLLEAAQDPKYARALREWLNRKNPEFFTDFDVHGYHLRDMLCRYGDPDGNPKENMRLSLLMALVPLYLEEHSAPHRGIAAFIGHVCRADRDAAESGEGYSHAILDDDGMWYLFGRSRGMMTADELADGFSEYDMWTLLLDEPALIQPLLQSPPPGTMIAFDAENPSAYQMLIPDENE